MLRALLTATVLSLIGLTAGSLKAQEEPRQEDLLAAVERTSQHIERRPIRWEIAFELPSGKEILVEVLVKGGQRRTRCFLGMGAGRLILLEVIEKDGYWYVTEENTRYKCWPYEAAFKMPALYTFMARGELQLYNGDEEAIGHFERMEGEAAVYRVPLAGEARSTVSAAYSQLLQVMAVSPVPNIELEEKLKTYREFIDKGSEIRINTRTGVIEKAGAINQIFRVTAFQKLRIVHPDTFKVDRQTWEDRTGSVAGEEYDWSDVILIASNPSWKPGSEKGDLETIMLNRKTGISRRVPFAYGAIIDACFSPDHRYCYVTGWIPYEGTIGVFAVDLETHEHFRLGSEPLLTGMNLVAEVSPDDSFLAVVQIEYEAGPLQFRLHLVDTESGDSIKIGDTHDMGSVNWLPESNGFILAIRENDGLLETKATRICHMDLDGKLTELCQGSEPRLLGKSRRILFKGEDGSWYTCNMQGEDRQIVGDGLKGFGSPSANNPADNVLMTKFDDTDGPRPYLVDINSGEAKAVDVGAGFWSQPRW
ncbi:TolB-like translocation protein [Bremerella sp. T1]|uniref:hypothetical protein n=1 Tax=Bremerella sp. TYQ1 TaxID=3119568 RepID=UPI001CCF83E0|nr:hypothetical protein [Bremerella volcania]UBM35081.1 hypothetical protein LA756_20665 [Bremerella volcania]